MARQAASEFDAELIARAMNSLLDKAKPGDYGLQYKPRGSIFGILARALRITEPEARRLITELQRRKLIVLHNVGPGPRLIEIKPPPNEPKRRRTRRKPEEQPAPEEELHKEAEPPMAEYSPLAVLDQAAKLQLQIERLVAQRDELLRAVLLMPDTIQMPALPEA